MPVEYPSPFLVLARELRRLPGIGSRTAERISLWLLSNKDARPSQLAEALITAATDVRPCRQCGFFSTGELCDICSQPARERGILCVVEQATDILPLEKTGAFQGLYHALGGRLAPLDHIGPDQLRIGPLLERVRSSPPVEIILALSADVEGEATTNYLFEILDPTGIPITRIAHGLPAGGGLEHADQITLQRALSGRRPIPARERPPATAHEHQA